VKRVLFLAYYFPPIGGAGAQRPARMVRHLRANGWDPVVVTGPGAGGGRWTPTDDVLARELPADVEVLRVPGPEPVQVEGRAQRWLRRPSQWSRWWVEGAVETGHAVAGIDLVYCWLSPFETTGAASRLARVHGVPWVADLGDPWALDEMMVYPTGVHRRLEVARMGRSLSTAAGISMSTAEAVERVRASFPALDRTSVVAVPNGFDADDFAAPVAPRADGVFRVVHTGYLHTALGLRHRRSAGLRGIVGGAVGGVDFLTRSHVYLVEAVDRLRERCPELAGNLEVHLAGVLSPEDERFTGRTGAVRTHGYLSHDETLDLIRTADLLFLPMQDLPAGRRATIVPGKTYEYLGAGRPILGALPDGDARSILSEAGHALIVRPGDVEGMERALARQLRRARADQPPLEPRADVVARYEYGLLASRLAGLFDAAVGARAPARRAVEPHAVPARASARA
jgi:glycosyltransferase involved in cell wall biosynthesis